MSRKSSATIREVLPDPIYSSENVTKLINGIMQDGKKGTAQKILYSAFNIIEKEMKEKPLDVFNRALDNIMPILELKVRRIGGSNYQIPVEVRERRKRILGLRWLVQYAKARSENDMDEKLAKEIMAASKGEGASVKKREDVHRMAEANKAFSHFKW